MPMIGEWYIPEKNLDSELEKLIPAEDTILYTTAIIVQYRSKRKGKLTKVGELAITNRGVAFFARKKGLTGGLISQLGGPVREYIRYDQIAHIEGKGKMVHIRVTPPVDSDKPETEFELIVERSEPYEDAKTFKRRRGQFSAVLELAMYRYRTGQASPLPRKPIQHPATAVRATPRSTRRVIYCPRCGTFLEDPAQYCENCGIPLK